MAAGSESEALAKDSKDEERDSDQYLVGILLIASMASM